MCNGKQHFNRYCGFTLSTGWIIFFIKLAALPDSDCEGWKCQKMMIYFTQFHFQFLWEIFCDFLVCKGSFTNYVDKILAFCDHLPHCVDIFYGKVKTLWEGHKIWKNLPILSHFSVASKQLGDFFIIFVAFS